MDKASAYGAEDSRFDPWTDREYCRIHFCSARVENGKQKPTLWQRLWFAVHELKMASKSQRYGNDYGLQSSWLTNFMACKVLVCKAGG
eukprot:jgi/Botrbrau1/7554/Bobra.0159s0004.1